MNINQNVALNLSADGIPPRLHMMQGDSNTRTIIATLWDGAQPYTLPTGFSVMVRFRKPDGTGGIYDTTEGGAKVTFSGSTVTAPVATQMLAVAGVVQAQIDVYGTATGKAAEKLATFRFAVEVAPSVYPDAEIISNDYYNIIAAQIAAAVEAGAKADAAIQAAQTATAAATTATNAKNAAVNAKTAAESAKNAAAGSATTAANAKTAAENAKTAAENAKTAAESAKNAAAGSATTAANGAASAEESAALAQQYAAMAAGTSVSAVVSGTKLVLTTAGQIEPGN